MNNILYIIFILFISFNISTAEGQTLKLKYKKQIVPNADKMSRWVRSASEKRRYMQRQEKKAQNQRSYYILLTDGHHSSFTFDTTILISEERQDRSNWWWSGNEESFINWEKEYTTGTTIIRSKYLADTICTAVNYKQKYQWKLSKGNKVFADMLCNKALYTDEEGDTTIAWFSRSIPISGGPEEYGGLPGLILAIETSSFIYIAENITKVDNTVDYRPIKPENCLNEEDFREQAWEALMEKRLQNDEE